MHYGEEGGLTLCWKLPTRNKSRKTQINKVSKKKRTYCGHRQEFFVAEQYRYMYILQSLRIVCSAFGAGSQGLANRRMIRGIFLLLHLWHQPASRVIKDQIGLDGELLTSMSPRAISLWSFLQIRLEGQVAPRNSSGFCVQSKAHTCMHECCTPFWLFWREVSSSSFHQRQRRARETRSCERLTICVRRCNCACLYLCLGRRHVKDTSVDVKERSDTAPTSIVTRLVRTACIGVNETHHELGPGVR
jgi:hypothetical protein